MQFCIVFINLQVQLDNKNFMEDFLNETSKWDIDFHEIILIRDVPVLEQLAVKDEYLKLNKLQQC